MVIYNKLSFPTKKYFIIGSNIHAVLEYLHLQAMNGIVIKENEIKDIVEKLWIPVGKSKVEDLKIMKAIVRYVKDYIKHYSKIFNEIFGVEKEFWVYFNEGMLTGKIDLIRKNKKNEFEIVDFKLGLVPGFDVREQLKTYLLGVKLGLNMTIFKAIIHVLKTFPDKPYPTPLKFNFDDGEIRRTEDVIIETMKKINNGKFKATPSKEKCKECELTEYDLCPFSKK